MRILIACEYSARVRKKHSARGHDAESCDILPSDDPTGKHYQGDVLDIIDGSEHWDMMIAFPPCTKLSGVGAGHFWKWQADGSQQEAIDFFMTLVNAQIDKIVIENPQGIMSTEYRKPDQAINPWQFGEPWKKRTNLWLKGVSPLVPTDIVEPIGHWVDGGSMKSTKGNIPFGGYSPAECRTNAARAHARSRTFAGIANAMAEQWG